MCNGSEAAYIWAGMAMAAALIPVIDFLPNLAA